MTTITSENVKFNGTLSNAAVLKNVGNVKTLILTDTLSAADRTRLDAFIAQYGSNPLAGPTAGKQVVNFTGSPTGATATGLSNIAAATAGTATVNIGGNKTGGSASGLAAKTGTSGVQIVNLARGVVGSTATGLANDITTYTISMTIDGVSTPVSVVGSAAQTFTTLITEINVDLGAAGSVALVGGDLKFTSATTGLASKVRLNSGTLLPALTAYQGVFPPADGDNTGRTYSANFLIDGTIKKTATFDGSAGVTLTNVLTAINTGLAGAATAAITGGNIVITSATTGKTSSVRVYDTGFLFALMTGYVGITSTDGVDPTTYTATIVVDGVTKSVSAAGNTMQTFTTLVAALNTALGAAGTAAIAGGAITVTSATTGTSSSVAITDGNLFKNVAGFTTISDAVAGATDLVAEMQKAKVGGASLYDEFKVISVGLKPALPAVPAALPKTLAFTYWNGTVWKYLVDGSNV